MSLMDEGICRYEGSEELAVDFFWLTDSEGGTTLADDAG